MLKRWIRGLAALLLFAAACTNGAGEGGADAGPPPYQPGETIKLSVGDAFSAGTVVRDRYSGRTATVAADGTATVEPDAAGVVLLEKDGATPTPFTWRNATVYFVVTDRFHNGDAANDTSYGRAKDGASEVGTWHGGDWKGLTAKLDHVASVGADAVWITPIVEQVHGWVGGGSGDFKHYAYAGYWALDFTRLDANLGTPAEFGALVDAAHAKQMRVLVDVVLNHPGYATGADLVQYSPEVINVAAFQSFQPSAGKNWHAWNDLVDYGNRNAWRDYWWGWNWVRAGINGYVVPGNDDLTKQQNYLPDFMTESATVAGKPPLFNRKTDTGVAERAGATVRDYLVGWHADWVRQYGIDGFRCDTAKHVELPSWAALKQAGAAALAEWKAANPAKKPDDAPFWMTGEVFPHGVEKDQYFTEGKFDSLINFDFQPAVTGLVLGKGTLAAAASDLDAIYARYATALADPALGALSYLSSHDTSLAFETLGHDAAKQRQAATALLLSPGAVQIYYGDETGRRAGPNLSDATQGTRSDMNWESADAALLAHWQKLGAFRRAHAAVGAGTHKRLDSPPNTYVFARKLQQGGVDDAVVVAVLPPK